MIGLDRGSLRVMMVFAHADDETLLAGALISKLVRDGHDVKVLCLAPGGDDRVGRLRGACVDLGVSAVETLRFSESPMWPDDAGDSSDSTAAHLDPQLSLVPSTDLARKIAGRISEDAPDVVVTHSSYGDYGNSDHAAAFRATKLAVESVSGDAMRLYSLEWPRLVVRINARMMRIGGRSIRRMGPDGSFDLTLALQRSKPPTISIDVYSELGARRKASRWYCLEISKGPLPMRLLERLPLFLQRYFLGKARLRNEMAPEGFDQTTGL
jgi:N-acetyl-1-D-myo-inositol-2-amino-2-deoxy-alpha-D-glucopyranoside deacetylase